MISVKNWDRFQDKTIRGRERKNPPPWIKLWLGLPDDPAVRKMTMARRWVYVETLTWAGRLRNEIPEDDAWWNARFRRGAQHRDALIASGLLLIEEPSGDQVVTKWQPDGNHLAIKKAEKPRDTPQLVVLDEDQDEDKTLAGAKRAARQDVIWDVLVEVFKSSPAPKTSAHGARNKAVQDLKANGATPELIRLVVKKYVEQWGKDRLTDTALAKHYPALAGDLTVARRNRAAACSVCGIGGGQHAADCERVAA